MSDLEYFAARMTSAMADIVAILGPENICDCEHPPSCGLPEEAFEALRVAKAALAGANHVDGPISPEYRALAAAEASSALVRQLSDNLSELKDGTP